MSKNNIDNADERREARRKRRIRNQTIAYIVLIIILLVAGFGGYKGAKILLKKFNQFTAAPEQNASNNEASVSDDVPGVIASPEEPEEIIETTQEEPENEGENAEARAYVESLTLEQKVAGLFLVTPESITGVDRAVKAGEGTKNALAQYAVGGFVYDSKNVQSADQFKELLSGTQAMYKELYSNDMWLVLQEEGAVNTLAGSSAGVSKASTAGEIGSTGDSGNAYQTYITIGSYIAEYGSNMNLAPAADVIIDENNFIGNRSFGNDADIVSSMVAQAVNGQKEMGITTCLTGFPGRGAASGDPANGSASTSRTLDEMRECEFKPYKAGIDQGADVVVVSNITASEISGELPCSLAPEVLTDILRGELEFNGIVMVGNMDDKAITDVYSSGDAAVMAICAGADMIMRPANFQEAYEAVIKAVNEGVISEERINQSLMRIYTAKNK